MTKIIKYCMRNLITGLTLLAIVMASWAESRRLNKPVVCDTTGTVFQTIVEEYEETPQWSGTGSEGTNIVLTVNLRTGTWTLIEYTAVTACVIGVGENSQSRWGIPV